MKRDKTAYFDEAQHAWVRVLPDGSREVFLHAATPPPNRELMVAIIHKRRSSAKRKD